MDQWDPRLDPYLEREAKKYTSPIPSREFILSYLEQKKKPFSRQQLAVLFQLKTEFAKEAFRRRLRAMVRDGQIIKRRDGKYVFVVQGDLIRGRIITNNEGTYFVKPEDGTSKVSISMRDRRNIFPGDMVAVRIIGFNEKHRREGSIVEVLEYKRHEILGRFFVNDQISFVTPHDLRISHDIIIPETHNLVKAKPEDMVIVELITPQEGGQYTLGKIIKVIGTYMSPGMEAEVAIHIHDLPCAWPEVVKREIETLTPEITKSTEKNRVDLRELAFVTIDGEDAKDFDDAVYCEPREHGGWRLWVAIADVGYYVQPGTALDKEALKRGNSVYFTGRVVPMLPEILSDDLCSLKPNVDRLSFVCDMQINPTGEIQRFQFYQAIIKSRARLTYTQVARELKEESQKKTDDTLTPFLLNLRNLHALYIVLAKARDKRGALDFDTTEIAVEFDARRKIKRLFPIVRTEAHRLIEECMICANVCAARFLVRNKLAALFRVHDGPNPDKLVNLKLFLGELGLRLSGGDLPSCMDYAKMLKCIRERNDAHLLQMALMRSLSQATYTPDFEGHFGLGLNEYTHFTSPIRRYSDLIVHRAIQKTLENVPIRLTADNYESLRKLGAHLSMTERRADEATDDALQWLKCEYMLNKIGEEYEGVVSGVTGFGMFVELKNIFIEGLVHMTAMQDDYYHFDPIRHRLIGDRTRTVFCIGDPVAIKVVRVDLEKRQIDFSLVGSYKSRTVSKKRKMHGA